MAPIEPLSCTPKTAFSGGFFSLFSGGLLIFKLKNATSFKGAVEYFFEVVLQVLIFASYKKFNTYKSEVLIYKFLLYSEVLQQEKLASE